MEHAPRSPSPPPATSQHRTHHMLCLQVLPQLLAEVIGAEFHNHSPAGLQPSVQRTSPRVPPPRFPPSLQPLPPRRSLPPFLGRLRRQHFRLLAPLNSQHLGGFLPTVSQSEPDWRAASPAVPLAHPPPASRRRSKSLCRLSRSLQDHSPVLFPKPRFCSPGYPALSEVRGPRNHPQLWPFNPESPDGPCSKTRALLRCLLALLPEPSASGPRLRWIHCQSCSSGPATQRGSQERWSMADQRARTLVRRRGCLVGRLRVGGGPLGQRSDRGGTGFFFFFFRSGAVLSPWPATRASVAARWHLMYINTLRWLD